MSEYAADLTVRVTFTREPTDEEAEELASAIASALVDVYIARQGVRLDVETASVDDWRAA